VYTPATFKEQNLERIHQLIRDHPFGILVGEGTLEAVHLPFVLEPKPETNDTLIFHIARANPIWKQFARGSEALAIFSGPHAYISPDWYGAEEQVPTWNYAAVHAYGVPEIIEDMNATEEILSLLTETEEARLDKVPWRTDRLSQQNYDKLRSAIVCCRMPITRFEGKWKFNQNKTHEQRERVVKALMATGHPSDREVAEIMRRLDHKSE